ncbi:MAG: hypothetical protein IH905_17345, partial [Proteobacteria bacterium]|nr:hypothetical protein [Pseudomonadota bacterium]
MARANDPKIMKAVEQIRKFHEDGLDSLDRFPREDGRKKGVTISEGKRLRMSRDKLERARVFALEYNEKQLDELCR